MKLVFTLTPCRVGRPHSFSEVRTLYDGSPTLLTSNDKHQEEAVIDFMGSHSDCTLPSSVPDCLALSILPPSYLLLSLFIYLAILARALSDDSATFLMVRFPGNLRQVLCSLPPSRLPSPLLAQFCENGRGGGGGGAYQSDVSVGGRSNAVVYARWFVLHRDREV